MSTIQILLISFVAGFAYFSRRFMGDLYLERPVIIGPIVGLIMGDFEKGLVIGGTLELVFMGAVDIGGSVPMNYTIGTALGTAFAINSGESIEFALVVAVPAAILGSLFETFAKTISTIFVTYAEKSVEEGRFKSITVSTHLGNIVHGLSDAIPTFLALKLGSDAVNTMIEAFPEWLKNGVGVAGSMLPALGFSLLLSSLATRKLMPFFFLGFVLVSYLDINLFGASFIAILIALIIQVIIKDDETEYEDSMQFEKVSSSLSDSDFKRLYWRSFGIQSAFSFDRMQALGFTWGLKPFLEKIYAGNDEGLKEAYLRHLSFINTHPWDSGPIYVLTAELEAKKAAGENIDGQTIQGLKSSLMGPLAGIGDSLFHGTLRPIVGGLCAGLAIEKNVFAPLIFFFATNIVHVLVQWFLMKRTREIGENTLRLLSTQKFNKFMEGASMTGLFSVGALVASWLNINTGLKFTVGEATVELQAMLDNIMPGILALLFTLLILWLIRKNISTTKIMILIIILGIVTGALGTFV